MRHEQFNPIIQGHNITISRFSFLKFSVLQKTSHVKLYKVSLFCYLVFVDSHRLLGKEKERSRSTRVRTFSQSVPSCLCLVHYHLFLFLYPCTPSVTQESCLPGWFRVLFTQKISFCWFLRWKTQWITAISTITRKTWMSPLMICQAGMRTFNTPWKLQKKQQYSF